VLVTLDPTDGLFDDDVTDSPRRDREALTATAGLLLLAVAVPLLVAALTGDGLLIAAAAVAALGAALLAMAYLP
jgi:VIT1/CCC1 family predicted Fe2+/Mn2+ transporter